MTKKIKQRMVVILKIITVISFLCIIIDNGKFELPMALLLLGTFAVGGSFGYASDMTHVLYSVLVMLYGILLCASLMCLFISAVTPYFSKKATFASVVAILILWVQVGLTASTSLRCPSFVVALTHAIFAFLSLATLVFMGLAARSGKTLSQS